MSLEKFFHLKENHTDAKTEIMAGITSFMTMAYILAVIRTFWPQPEWSTVRYLPRQQWLLLLVHCAWHCSQIIRLHWLRAWDWNAYFAYTVVLGMGYSWQVALAAVLTEGIIFILLSLFNVREAIFNAIPFNLKKAVSVGIGLFITFIGLQNGKNCYRKLDTVKPVFSGWL